MALFFDVQWFDARLADRGMDRAGAAAVLGMPKTEFDLVAKDQRELAPREVRLLAELLGQEQAEVARRAGVGTAPAEAVENSDLASALERISLLEARVAQLEEKLAAAAERTPKVHN